jgi:hypothetical protein
MFLQTHFEAHPVVEADEKASSELHSVHALVSLVVTHVEEEQKGEHLKPFLAIGANSCPFDDAPMHLRHDHPEHSFPDGESAFLDCGRRTDPYLHEAAAETLCCNLLELG